MNNMYILKNLSFLNQYMNVILGSKTADDVVLGQNSSMERTWCARRTSKPLHRANLLPQHCSRQSSEPKSYV